MRRLGSILACSLILAAGSTVRGMDVAIIVNKENPIAVENVRVSLNLPGVAGRVKSVRFLTPEQDQPQSLPFRQNGVAVEFTAPSFLVYGVFIIQY